MNLVIHSHQSADILLGYVEKFFSEIPNRNIQPLRNGMEEPFLHHMGRIVIGEMRSNVMMALWQTPNLSTVPNQIGAFITYLLNAETKGSLFQVLQIKGLIYQSKSKILHNLHNAHLFIIHISLTEVGLVEVTKIIEIIYDYLRMLRNMSVEEYETQWDNFVRIEEVNFDMMTGITRGDYVE